VSPLMAETLGRRDFLVYSGAALAGVTLGETGRRWLARVDERVNLARPAAVETSTVSVCRECLASCGIRVRVVDGAPVKLDGNPACPLARGRLCAKGQAAIESYYDPDRLVGPAKRVGRRGEPRWARISWDEAFAIFAARLAHAREGHGAILAVAAAHHGPIDDAWRAFWEGVGGRAASVAARTADRLLPRLNALTGAGSAPVFDLEHATYVLSFGAPIVEDWLSPVWAQRSYGRFRRGASRARGRLVQVEERRSTTARKADEWLPLASDRQAFLAYGLASVLLRENRVDRARLAAASVNFPDFERDVLARFTPDVVAAATGVPVVTLLRLARDLTGTARPLVAVAADADADLVDAVFALNALVGALDRAGGVLQAVAPGSPRRNVDAIDALVDFAVRPTAADVVVLRDASALRALDIGAAATAAFERGAFVVSLSPYLDEAAAVADLLLPAHTSLESWHAVTPPAPEGAELFACARPAVGPRLDTRDLIAILHATAERLPGNDDRVCPFANGEAVVQAELARRWTLRRGAIYAGAFETDWTLQLERGGWWVAPAATEASFAAQVLDAGGWIDPFFTPGGLAEAAAARGGLTFLPPAAPAPGAPAVQPASLDESSLDRDAAGAASGDREWPLRLVPFTPPEVNLAGGPNQPVLFELLGQPDGAPWRVWAEINPETARGLGIANGAPIRIVSPAGAIDVTAMIVNRTPPEIVAVAFVPSLRTGGRWAKLVSADVRQLFGAASADGVRVRVMRA